MAKQEKRTNVTNSAKWYRRRIIEMVRQIRNKDYLFKIYHYILAKYRRNKE